MPVNVDVERRDAAETDDDFGVGDDPIYACDRLLDEDVLSW